MNSMEAALQSHRVESDLTVVIISLSSSTALQPGELNQMQLRNAR